MKERKNEMADSLLSNQGAVVLCLNSHLEGEVVLPRAHDGLQACALFLAVEVAKQTVTPFQHPMSVLALPTASEDTKYSVSIIRRRRNAAIKCRRLEIDTAQEVVGMEITKLTIERQLGFGKHTPNILRQHKAIAAKHIVV